ncbi:DUF2797 domain-containing protein [Streptomyces sp. NPDC093225]|uniref:DUF2797 domain-containing protein n=1 Tax=Streptomyces sp. NPDC093225 TaxID=3366034 RepID=UPI00381FCC45
MWCCTGLRWRPAGPALTWYAVGSEQTDGTRRTRESPLAYGRPLAFAARGARRCVGVRRAGRWTPCPGGREVPARAGRDQCPECARLDRSFSVAADTNAADPRPYRVYLAWFGPGLTKVGITAEERGPARLLEQGAVAHSWLGRGPLMAARRTEEVLRAALGVPDRIPYARKRAVRAVLPPVAERRAELAGLHARALGVPGWTETLEPLPCVVADHAEVFGLAGLPRPTGVVAELVDGGTVAGRLVAAAGPDLHLADGLVVDTRLLCGWVLTAPGETAGTSVPIAPVGPDPAAGQEQPGLF